MGMNLKQMAAARAVEMVESGMVLAWELDLPRAMPLK